MPIVAGACQGWIVRGAVMAEEAPKRLERRADGRVLAGVCRGLAEHLGIEPVVVRLAFVLLIAAGWGSIAYVAFWILVPRRENDTGPRAWGHVVGYAVLAAVLSVLT